MNTDSQSDADADGQHQATGRESGKTQATQAITAGTLLLKEYPPLPSPPAHAEYVALLRKRCGVDYAVPRLPAGTDATEFIQHIRGWNEVMKAEIRRKFGAQILDKLQQEAKREWQLNIKRQAP